MKKKVVSLVLLFVILFSNIAFAATKEQLEVGYTNTFNSLNDEDTKITETKAYDDRVEFLLNGTKYEIKYTLTENPTFTMEIPIIKGMSYKDYRKLEENFDTNMYSYVAYAYANGVTVEDAKLYLMIGLASGISNSLAGSTGKSVIVAPPGVTVTDSGGAEVFYEETFGDDVIRYVNYMYSEKQSINDEKELNSFKYEKWIENVDSSTCKIVTKLEIKKDFNFNKINDAIAKIKEEFVKKMQENKANADHVVQLKIGQKCKVITVNKINGYSSMGKGEVDISDDKTEVTGKGAGDKYIEFMLENNITKKVYFEILENTNNAPLDTITLVLQESADNQPVQEFTNTVTNTVTNTTPTPAPTPAPAPSQPQQSIGTVTGALTQGITKLPNAGYHVKNLLTALYIALVVLIIMLVIKVYRMRKEK